MIKKLLPILLMFSFVATSKVISTNTEIPLKNSLLWKITGNDITEPSYLYGTMHLMCDTSVTKKAKVKTALDSTDQLYLEVDLSDTEQMMGLMDLMTKEQKIKDIQDETKKQLLIELVETHLGIKSKVIESTTVFNVFTMMAYKATDACALPTSAEETLESQFIREGDQVHGLETMQQQMEFVANSGVANLDNTIIGLQEFDDMKEIYQDMNNLYMEENVSGLFALIAQPSDVYPEEYINKMLDILLAQRNQNWVTQIPEIAKKSPTFFGVGAGHLAGTQGVINLLREKGYTVEAVMDMN